MRVKGEQQRVNVVAWLILGADFLMMLAALMLVLPPQSFALSVLAPHVAAAVLMAAFGPYLFAGVDWLLVIVLLIGHLWLMHLLVRRVRTFEVFGRLARLARRLALGAAVLLSLLACYYEFPVKEHYEFASSKVSGEPVRLAVISDLHSCSYGGRADPVLRDIAGLNADAVLLTGDIFDDRLSDDNAQNLVKRIVDIYPCFYVSGNHEYWSERIDEMKAWLRSVGVAVLEGECVTLSVKGTRIDICGVDDPTYMSDDQWLGQLKRADEQSDSSHLRILLTHRPERVSDYEQFGFDLIFAGHAHGGQWRIPFTGCGGYAPDQYFFPRYVDGRYDLANGSVMLVSRGLARESTPLPRLFNSPEILVLDIGGR